MSVLFLTFFLVISLLHCHAVAEKQTGSGENSIMIEYDRTPSQLLSPQQYSSYLGGSGGDELASFVFVEPDIVYLAGSTTSTDFPVVNGYQDTNAGGIDCFVMKFNIATETVVYSTYVGGSSSDVLYDIAVDDEGNLYATGATNSGNFPTVNPYQSEHSDPSLQDVFVFKLSPSGDELLYSTYFGQDWLDIGCAIDIDSSGNAFVFGRLIGGNITIKNPIDEERNVEEGFLVKFNSTGNGLDFSSYIGGSVKEYPATVLVDDDDAVYLIGRTDSDDMPGLDGYDTSFNGVSDCFIMKINSSLTGIDYSTYIGGANYDEPHHASVDSSGTVYVTGHTSSTDFPTVSAYNDKIGGSIDCFVFSLDPDGESLGFSTYLGGSSVDYGVGITTYLNEAVFVTGNTRSTDFPITNGLDRSHNGEEDCFVSKLNLSTNTLDYSTYLGGSLGDYGVGIAIDADENIIVAGYTESEDFLTESSHMGSSDWFLYVIPKPELGGFELPPWILYVGVGAGAVVIIAAVVYLRRRYVILKREGSVPSHSLCYLRRHFY
jgi:hypothetical protein